MLNMFICWDRKDQHLSKDMFLLFILHWKKKQKQVVYTENYSHSWEHRLITVDVRWALWRGIMGRKWLIIERGQRTEETLCETSHLPEIQRCSNTPTHIHDHLVTRLVWQKNKYNLSWGGISTFSQRCAYFCVSVVQHFNSPNKTRILPCSSLSNTH